MLGWSLSSHSHRFINYWRSVWKGQLIVYMFIVVVLSFALAQFEQYFTLMFFLQILRYAVIYCSV